MTEERLQYEGFLSTGSLLIEGTLGLISNFEINIEKPETHSLVPIPNNIVLGKRVEFLFESYINNSKQYEVLSKNIQIIENKVTVGELDFILSEQETGRVIHVELVYKFYLYLEGENGLSSWIGPNQNDSLVSKLKKLRLKQFPLLNLDITKTTLSKLNIKAINIEQEVCFLGSLFLPYKLSSERISSVNPKCVVGWWMTFNGFISHGFENFIFFIPNKKDWLLEPKDTNHHWLSYTSFLEEVQILHERKKSPLCWIKKDDNFYERFFIVWW